MTDEPQEEATTEPAAEKAGELTSGSEVTASIHEAGQDAEQLRLAQDALREDLEQLKSLVKGASSLTTTTGELYAEFKQTAAALATERQELEREKAALVARQQAISRAEQQRDEGFAEQRAAVERELAERRASALTTLETELTEARSTRLAEVTASESAERDRIRAEITKERTDWDQVRIQQQEDLKQQRDELEKQKGAVSALQSELGGKRVALDNEELDLEGRTLSLKRQIQKRRDNLDEDVAALVTEERKSLESWQQAAAEEADRLRATIQSQTSLLGAFDHLQQQLGGREPGAVILELNAKSDEIKRLTEELATRPTEEVRTRLSAMESELQSRQNQIDELERQLGSTRELASQSGSLKRSNLELEQKNTSLERLAKAYEAEAVRLQSEVDRLHAAYERPAESQARYREIERPTIQTTQVVRPTQDAGDEIDWLNRVARNSEEYGLRFSRRILHSFHTALKTADWSPLTVLAGVSGTGKSELPRLYSHFGGLYHESLAVQPNWDSQESMLGFFNSIDNKFDAQPVLHFLAQSQKAWEEPTDNGAGYPGLRDSVCLVLLDEMNLAHPELYFAEFLSKLEQRRNMKGTAPELPVKIGTGMAPYPLSLGRNVLWVGTMNQDETTKSLSDKVLDRSIIINFPRPTELQRRKDLKPLDSDNRGPTLARKTWERWTERAVTFTLDEIKPFKSFIEDLNAHLAVAGRAVGHRVWQAVEYYMANYPDVRAAGDDSSKKAQAMHVAFEDQLVQKVMPKLRGIDTRGDSRTDCLDKIQLQLRNGIAGNEFNLDEDFELALRLGYGQFIWQSANYLQVEASDESD
jgi:hypothetical protein